MLDKKISAYEKLVIMLPDKPNASNGLTAEELKMWFDSAPEQIRVAFNSVLDELASTVGAGQIGTTEIAGVLGSNIQTVLESIKDLIDGSNTSLGDEIQVAYDALATHKTSSDHDGRYYTEAEVNALLLANQQGNHLGTWQGYSPVQTDPGIQNIVNTHTEKFLGFAYDVFDFGAKGDGATDDTVSFNNAIQQCILDGVKAVKVSRSGTYMIDALTSIQLQSNMSFYIESGVILKAKTNSADSYSVLLIDGKENVLIINNGTIEGDRDTHTGITGESGMGIRIINSLNINLINGKVEKCWGDGVYIGGTGLTGESKNIFVKNVTSEYNRRNNFTIAAGKNMIVENCKGSFANGTSPQAGIDIEPNIGKPGVENIVVVNSFFNENNGPGISISQTTTKNVNVKNCFAFGNIGEGATISYCTNVLVEGTKLYDNTKDGISINGDNAFFSKGIKIDNCDIYNNQENGLSVGFIFDKVEEYVLSNNRVFDNNKHGVFVGIDCNYGSIFNNQVNSNGKIQNITYDNIYISDQSNFVQIFSNIVKKGINSNKPRYGINIVGNELCRVFDNMLDLAGQTANLNLPGTNTNISVYKNYGFVTENNVLSPTFSIGSTGYKEFTINHGCDYTPLPKDCTLTLIENSGVIDFKISYIKIRSVSSTTVTVAVLVDTASASGGATAYVALKVNRN